jgi:8-oxo-dGTP pyrophosphatase MutT (NUDIX family)
MADLESSLLRDLTAELARLKNEGPPEPEHLARMVALLEREPRVPSCASREQYDPGHFTASAFVLAPEKDELVLIHHKKLQLWLQPGGHLEAGDRNVVEAALREVEEETGLRNLVVLDPCFDLDIHEIPALGGKPAHLHFDVRVLLHSPTLSVVSGEGTLAAKWFPLERVARGPKALDGGIETDESVRRVAERLLARGGL